MIKVENIEVHGWEAAIRGMRNPYDSWDKSDSDYGVVGEQDLKLMEKLTASGSSHSKFLRMINVTMDITAPRYWWTEFDTYKVGTVKNSCSTMHMLGKKLLTIDDFSTDGMNDLGHIAMNTLVYVLNVYMDDLKTRARVVTSDDYRTLYQLLPQSYNQLATVQINYQVAMEMIRQRKHHKLSEWRAFCDILENLPYMKELLSETEEAE